MNGQVEKPPTATELPRWQEAIDLLASGRYQDAAALLQETEAAADANGDPDLTIVLQAAREICLAGNDVRAQIDHHQQAYWAATRREQQLRSQLQTLLGLISAQMADLQEHTELSSPTPEAQLNRRQIPGLLKRVKDLLGYRQDRQAAPDDLALGSATNPVPRESKPPAPTHGASSATTRDRNSHLASEETSPGPSLAIYCLGSFRVYHNDQLVTGWNGQKSQLIFKYLATQRSKPTAKDILMDVFWPDADPESARNNLNVAIYSLRQVFRALEPDFSHILFQDDCYLLNPAMEIWVDVEEFVQRCEGGQKYEREGRLNEAVREYGIAESLYQGDFFEEDLYEEWIMPRREGLKDCYLVILERLSRHYFRNRKFVPCIRLCHSILAKDDCRESAHRRLMLCYSRQGQRNLALRQYHLCVETLARVLDVSPTEETVALYQKIRKGPAV